MYCSNCGIEWSDQAQYCMNCGQELINTEGQRYENSNSGKSPIPVNTFLKPRFPVAGIFLILHGLLSLFNAIFEKEWTGRGWQPYYVGLEGEFFWPALLQFFIIIITAMVLFFWKEKDKILIGFLILYSLVNIAICIYNIPAYSDIANLTHANLFSVCANPQNWICFFVFFTEILSYCSMIFLVIVSSIQTEKMAALADRIWFVPGVLNCMEIVIFIITRENYMPHLAGIILCLILENFFLGWWLTHPYKKQCAHGTMNYASRQGSSARDALSYDRKSAVIPTDAPSFGYAVLGFFLPVVGLVLYLVWREQTPLRAKSAGKGALCGVITNVVLSVLLVILAVFIRIAVIHSYF